MFVVAFHNGKGQYSYLNNDVSNRQWIKPAESWSMMKFIIRVAQGTGSLLYPAKWSFGENLDQRTRIVLLHLKKKQKQWCMSTVALYIFRTIIFSFLSTVFYQSGDNHVLVYCAAYRKWCQINSKVEIRLVRMDAYWQYSFIWICSFLRGLTSVLEYFIIQKYLPS